MSGDATRLEAAPRLTADQPAPALRPEHEIVADWARAPAGDPLVSVICITYNHERFIDDALRGFLIQETDFPFEVIVHDDASEDGTAPIVRRWAKAYPRIIRPIFQDINQYTRGKNPLAITLPLARGRYIALCEGDDYWTDHQKLAVQKHVLDTNTNLAVCYHNVCMVAASGEVVSQGALGDKDRKDADSEMLKKVLRDIRLPTMCFRNTIGDPPPEFISSPTGDRFLTSLLGWHGDGRYVSDLHPSVMRRHAQGVSAGASPEGQVLLHTATSFWLRTYYRRIGVVDLEYYFAAQAVRKFLAGVAPGRTKFMLIFHMVIFYIRKMVHVRTNSS